jgi:hypothetical protein
MAAKKQKQYQVIGAYVTATIMGDDGSEQVRGFQQFGVLPDTVSQDSIDHLLSVALIEEVGGDGADLAGMEQTSGTPQGGEPATEPVSQADPLVTVDADGKQA